jgi:hypothetical protein
MVNGSATSAAITFGSTALLAESGLPSGATGTVAFFTSGHAALCSFVYGSLPGGNATNCATSATLAAATYSGIYATFTDSDGNYLGSTSTDTVSLTVNKANPTVTWAAPAAINYGTPLSSTQLDAKASVAGTFAYSPVAGTVLQAGSHTLSVTFTPSNATDYNSVSATTTISVGFTQACITTTVASLTVAKGQSLCIGSGGKVTGSVVVAAGGALTVSAGTIGGSLSSTGALGITVCGAKLSGSVSVTTSSGPVLIGGTGCAGDTLGGSVALSSNTGGVSFGGDHLTGSLSISKNSGGVAISGNTIVGSVSVTTNSGGVVFTNNTVSGSLAITNNTGGFTYSGNSISGSVTITGNS